MRQLIATILTLVLLTQPLLAKPKGNWDAVKASANQSIAFKTKDGETHFGLLQFVDDASIRVLIAGEKDFTAQEISVLRDEIEKIWRARLRFGERNIAKAAWIGAGAGLGVSVGTVAVACRRQCDDPPAGLGLFPIIGAGTGAIVGVFWKKKHRKQDLIYSL